MEKINLDGMESLIGKSYSSIGDDLFNSRKNIIKKIINNRCVPDEGLDELTIDFFLNYLAMMDSNNGINHIGIGEREGRIFSNIVKRRNYGLVHGIGRSGEVTELQPKAVGSSLLVQLTHSLLKNFLHSIGMNFIKSLIILPFATGMSITLSLLTLAAEKPNSKYVIWPRIDQKTCFKSMFTANLIPIVIEPIINGDELNTDINGIEKAIQKYGSENILCIFSTTSCFAPRGYDNIKQISVICKENNLFHIVNNAYGIYCTKIMDCINQSLKVGSIDLIISSTDKNFMVPVGGSIIYSSQDILIDKIKKNYPGRASISPILDLFITLLEMGKNKYKFYIKDRKEKFNKLKDIMSKVADTYGERVLDTPENKISLAFTLTNICKEMSKKEITLIGSLFYSRQVSGIKILAPSDTTILNNYKFKNYGTHSQDYKFLPYCAFAAAIGINDHEIDEFAEKFISVIEIYIKKNSPSIDKKLYKKEKEDNSKSILIIQKVNNFNL